MKVLLLGSDGDDKSTLAAGLRQSFEWVDVPAAQLEQYLRGGADAAVLIVSAPDGMMPEPLRHVELAQSAKLPVVAVYLSKCDMIDDEEMIDLVVLEVHEFLAKRGVGGDATPIARDVQAVTQALGASLPGGQEVPRGPAWGGGPNAAAPPVVGAVVCSRCGAPLPKGLGEVQCSYCGTLNMVAAR